MKKIIIVLIFFFSTNAIGDATGVYYCLMKDWVQVYQEGGVKYWKEEKFTFKIEKDNSTNKEQAAKLIFGEPNKYFPIDIIKGSFILSNSFFQGGNMYFSAALSTGGEFTYTKTLSSGAEVITANCSKF